MSIFLISFLSLYGSMHFYVFFRMRETFFSKQTTATTLALFMVLMTVAPLLVRISETSGFEKTALWIAWPAYIWMGTVFIFCTALAISDTIRITAWISHRVFKTSLPAYLSGAISCEIALVLALLASSYAIYEALKIRTDQITVTSAKLSPASPGIRIVQISDVHLGLLFHETRLASVLQAVKDAHPDILVSTGDLVDGRLSHESIIARLDKMAAMISAIPTRSGKFAVTGNHEYYAGLDQALEFTRKAGFTVLRNQSITLPEGISITGIDDPARRRMGLPEATPAESELLKSNSGRNFQLLLKHRPEISKTSDGLFDLQLSGHVHNGQIFPFNFLVRLQYPIPCGTTATSAGSLIHVSRGSGTWGPPMRLLAPPEVTIIDILPIRPAAQN